MNFDGVDLSILLPAMIAGLIVLSTHIPLGREVLRRNIIFIDIAIAQIAGLGVVIAHAIGADSNIVTVQLVAFASALIGAWILSRLEASYPKQQEALIGSSFVLASTAGILILASDPHAGEYLNAILIGQILWVDTSMLIYAAILSVVVLLLWRRIDLSPGRFGFYGLFAIAVTVSVQLVGVFLVFASLIIPALASCRYDGRRGVMRAMLVGVTGYIAGLFLSALFDLPSGAVIVWTLAAVALLLRLLQPAKT